MKIAVTTGGPGPDSPLDPRFGRAAGFQICDLDTGERVYMDNTTNQDLTQGAGIQAAQAVARAGAQALVTGRVGPKAFKVLQKGGVEIFLAEDGVVAELVEAYRRGKLPRADAPNR